jgi:hypothetical protein
MIPVRPSDQDESPHPTGTSRERDLPPWLRMDASQAGLADRHIRFPLSRRLADEHPDALVLHEMQLLGFAGYADIAVAGNSRLRCFEIKSDLDSFVRLPRQIVEYDRVADFCMLVVTERHLSRAEQMLPEHWGLLVGSNSKGGVRFLEKRASAENPFCELREQAALLTKAEVVSALRANGLGRAASRTSKERLLDVFLEMSDESDIKALTISILRLRRTWTCRQLGVGSDAERLAHGLSQPNPFICFTTNQMW